MMNETQIEFTQEEREALRDAEDADCESKFSDGFPRLPWLCCLDAGHDGVNHVAAMGPESPLRSWTDDEADKADE